MADTKIQIAIDAIDRAAAKLAKLTDQIGGMERAAKGANAGGFKQAEAGLAGIGAMASRIIPAVAAAFSVAAVTAFVHEAINANKALHDLAQELGTGAGQLGALREAAASGNIEVGRFSVQMRTLAGNIAEAVDPASRSANALRALGFTQAELSRGTVSLDEVMRRGAEQFPQWADGANKAKLAQELFGQAGSKWIPILNQGVGALKDGEKHFAAQAQASKLAADAQENFERSLQVLKSDAAAVAVELAGQLLPSITEFVGEVSRFAHSDAGLLAFSFLEAAVKVAAAAFRILALDVQKVTVAVNGAVTASQALKNLDFKAAGNAIKDTALEVGRLTAEQVKTVTSLFSTSTTKARELRDEIKASSDQQKADAPSLISTQQRLRELTEQRADAEAKLQIATAAASNDPAHGDERRIEAMKRYEEEIKKADKALQQLSKDDPAVRAAQRQAAVEQAKVSAALEQSERELNAKRLQGTQDMFNNMAGAAKAFGKEGFAAYQAFAIASATIDTYKAAIGAYNSVVSIPYVGPVLAPIAAAAAVAFGAAQIATIASQSPGYAGGGYTGDGGRYEPAGIVHRKEFVIPAPVVSAYGPGYFEARYMHGMRGRPETYTGRTPGFASGGYAATAARQSGSGMAVSFGVINTRQEMRNFQSRDGMKIVVDQLNKRGNRIVT